jgi:hypothetical protein
MWPVFVTFTGSKVFCGSCFLDFLRGVEKGKGAVTRTFWHISGMMD